MKQLLVLDNPRKAQAFVDYMASHKVECLLAPAGNDVAIWLKDIQHKDFVETELNAFLSNPNDSKYLAASWDVADTRKAKFTYGKKGQVSKAFFAHAGIVTISVLAIAAIVYAGMTLGFKQQMLQALFISPDTEQLLSQPWRVITPIFLHFSVLHIVFNSLWWWQLGGEIERTLGSGKLILITLVAAIIPNIAQLLATGPLFGGLSGVVYALLGYCWFSGWLSPEKGLHISRSIVGFMLVWLIIGFMDVLGPPMANLAHLFGLLVGCAQAVFDRFLNPAKSHS